MHTPQLGPQEEAAAPKKLSIPDTIEDLGSIPRHFDELVREAIAAIPHQASVHEGVQTVVDAGIDNRVGIDTLKRYARLGPIKMLFAEDLAAVVTTHLNPPSELPAAISKETIEYAVSQMMDYLATMVGGKESLHNRIVGSHDAANAPDEFAALFASGKFQKTLLDAFLDFVEALIDARFTSRMADPTDAAKAQYFGHFAQVLTRQPSSHTAASATETHWVALYKDAITHGVPADVLTDIIKGERQLEATRVQREREQTGHRARSAAGMFSYDTNNYSRFESEALRDIRQESDRAALAAGWFEGDNPELYENVHPLSAARLLIRGAKPGEASRSAAAYTAKAFASYDQQTANDIYYFSSGGRPAFPGGRVQDSADESAQLR